MRVICLGSGKAPHIMPQQGNLGRCAYCLALFDLTPAKTVPEHEEEVQDETRQSDAQAA